MSKPQSILGLLPWTFNCFPHWLSNNSFAVEWFFNVIYTMLSTFLKLCNNFLLGFEYSPNSLTAVAACPFPLSCNHIDLCQGLDHVALAMSYPSLELSVRLWTLFSQVLEKSIKESPQCQKLYLLTDRSLFLCQGINRSFENHLCCCF